MVPVIEMQDADVSSSEPRLTPVLEGVTWRVNPGDCWIVCGHSGSGKSDLLLTAAGLLRPDGGRYRLFGRDPARLSEDEVIADRLRVGFVFGGNGRLFEHLTIGENVAFPLCYHRNCRAAEVEERIAAVLEGSGVFAFSSRRPHDLNRHLRLQAALARALVLEPELIILDDPLNGVGPRERLWWIDFLVRLRNGTGVRAGRPATLVVATNDVRPLIECGSHFALLQHKRFRVVGGRAELERRAAPLVRELFSDSV